MKDFVGRLKKDLGKLQKDLKREGDDLVNLVRKAATKKNLVAKQREVQQMLDRKLADFEPAIEKFLKGISQSAAKAGLDISKVEKQIQKAVKSARTQLAKGGRSSGAKKKSATRASRSGRKAQTTTATTGSSKGPDGGQGTP